MKLQLSESAQVSGFVPGSALFSFVFSEWSLTLPKGNIPCTHGARMQRGLILSTPRRLASLPDAHKSI